MRIRRIITLGVIVLLFITGFMIFKSRISNETFSKEKVERLDISSQITPISNSSIILYSNGMLIEGDGANIKVRGADGRSLWGLQLENKIKDIISCGTDILVTTEKNSIIVLDSLGKITLEYKMPISPASIISDGEKNFLIQYNWNDHNTFEIYNTKGLKSCTGIIDKANVLSFTSSVNNLFTLSLLDVSTDKVLSKVATYNNNGEIVWATNYNSNLALKVEYVDKENIIVITENFLGKYNSKGSLLKEVVFEDDIANIAASKSLIVIVTKKNKYYEIYSYNTNLQQLGFAATMGKPKGVYASKDKYLIYSIDNLSIANKSGKIISLYESSFDINSAYIHTDNSVYIISNRRLLRLAP